MSKYTKEVPMTFKKFTRDDDIRTVCIEFSHTFCNRGALKQPDNFYTFTKVSAFEYKVEDNHTAFVFKITRV